MTKEGIVLLKPKKSNVEDVWTLSHRSSEDPSPSPTEFHPKTKQTTWTVIRDFFVLTNDMYNWNKVFIAWSQKTEPHLKQVLNSAELFIRIGCQIMDFYRIGTQ